MIRHAVRTLSGVTKTVVLTPLRAIRSFCLECLVWSSPEVEKCVDKLCSLYPWRSGHDSTQPIRNPKGGVFREKTTPKD